MGEVGGWGGVHGGWIKAVVYSLLITGLPAVMRTRLGITGRHERMYTCMYLCMYVCMIMYVCMYV